ncbi:MAG: RNA-binding S4 domain-containing protein [Planctomycetota bacterium]
MPEPEDNAGTSDEPMRLDRLLKLAGLVDTGGQAKFLIQAGEVSVNGSVETRRRRKISVGDVVTLGDSEVVYDE